MVGGDRAAGPSLAGAGDKDTGKAKSPDVERIMSTAHEECQAMDHLDVLCNRIGPRLTGSDNLTNACEWVRDRFASFGIDNARLESWGEFPVGFDRGPWFGRVIQPEPKALEFVDDGVVRRHEGSRPRQGRAAPNNKKELDEAKEKGTLDGAWVLMPRAGGSGPRPEPAFRRSLRKELEDAKVAGIVAASGQRTVGDRRPAPDLLGQAADRCPRSLCCASNSTSSPAGSRTASPSRWNLISAITSRRDRSSSTM